jgi:osmoprotectant transport system ATP-binding protein
MINRMIEPSAGSITIDGADIAGMPVTRLRRSIGYVIQHAGLFPNKTVQDNIATIPRLLGFSRRNVTTRVEELMDLVGLAPELLRRYPRQLSGGQQQRVGVARALAADPPILLMDEPFSAVDPVVRTQLQDELIRLQGELSKTIVFVTHDIDEAIRVGDHVAVMRPGGVLAQFSQPDELLSAPADGFVADFLGRDRGYRALGFRPSGQLPLHEEHVIALGARADSVDPAFLGGWALVVGPEGRPVGWLSKSRLRWLGSEPITETVLNLGGTLGDVDGTLRSALDAALSSPSGRGVVVDRAGRFAGTVRATEVLTLIEAPQPSHTELA